MGRTGRTDRSMYEGKFDPTGSSTLPLRLRKTGGGKNRKMAMVEWDVDPPTRVAAKKGQNKSEQGK
ncbi:hypothetical protein Patl1_13888 [Pistacia atlantica]|uniref:Uncharacterized protein n=1 Tax=Pistacia atlantica TaxID=434234 RepID=A0ACC1AVF8_9ROSI|nr:hypothetical protein Patl1_13888 [Pistacia atlantica]